MMTTGESRSRSSEQGAFAGTGRWLAGAGIVAPWLFAGVVIVMGLREPGYDHRTQMMSMLGGVGGVRGTTFNVGLALTGVLLVAFAVGLHRKINAGQGSKAGPLLVALGGAGLIGSAIFHCNEGCTNILQAPTFAGRLHSLTSFITGASLALAPLVILPRLRRNEQWRDYVGFTLAMGILANIPGLIFWGSLLTTRLPAWEGLLQRLGIAFPLLWVEVTALRLTRLPPRAGWGSRSR